MGLQSLLRGYNSHIDINKKNNGYYRIEYRCTMVTVPKHFTYIVIGGESRMTLCNCENKCNCTGIAIIASAIIGIITAFLQITAVITVTPVFLWVALGVAVVYLAVTLITVARAQRPDSCRDKCFTLSTVLAGILGTILFSILLLAIEFAATSVIGTIFVGALLLFASLMITSTACLVKCLASCGQ